MKTYKQLTYELRSQIYALKKIGMSQKKMAEQLNIHQSTISRELSRNTGKRGYRIKQAQTFSDKRRLSAFKAIKMTVDLIALIDSKVREEWSPEQISGWLREEQNTLISHETIYLHIGSDKQRGGQLFQHLRRRLTNHVARTKKQAEVLLKIVSALMSVRQLSKIKPEWMIGKLT